MSFVHLHTHSYYSFLEGLASPEDLVKAASLQGCPALALTDHRALTGTVPFIQACRAEGIRPILGLEVDLRLPYRLSSQPGAPGEGLLVLLVQDAAGWSNLCRISSMLMGGVNSISSPNEQPERRKVTSGDEIHVPGSALTLEQLSPFCEGLICLSGGCRGLINILLNPSGDTQFAVSILHSLKDCFGGRLYLELDLQQRTGAMRLAEVAGQLKFPTVAAQNIYYTRCEQADLQRTAAAIRENRRLANFPESLAAPSRAWFPTNEEVAQFFSEFKIAACNTNEVADQCQFNLPLGEDHYPNAMIPEGSDALHVLRERAEAGARRLYGEITAEIGSRLNQELEVIGQRGYAPIFLIAQDILAHARLAGIPTASRGSASSSLVAHCAGITTPDPLAHDLYFERFLNPARKTPPDIDTDICSRRRDELLRYIFDTYGADRTAMVGSVSTFRPRSALQDTAKAYGLKPPEIRSLASGLPHWFGPRAEPDHPTPLAEGPFAVIARQNPQLQPLLRDASALLGLPRHLTVHPGGVVIAPGPMLDYLPLTSSASKGLPVSQFELDAVEAVGLIKLDLLGVRGLTVLGDIADAVYSWRRTEFRSKLDVLDCIPVDDPETADLVVNARTIGCFSIESPGMRATLKEIHARSAADIMAALALFRPGPMKGGLRDAFVRRHNRLEAVAHLHPALAGLLQETYGVILYQEQVLRIAHELAGMSLAEADLLRRAMSHFNPGKQMDSLMTRFVEGAGRVSQVPPDLAQRIWEMMAAFAGYGFPKAHAASYAMVAWRSAWCKAHYPAEFIAAVLANHGGYYPQSVYLNEARRLKLKVKAPHVNHSQPEFSVSYPNGEAVLYMGLDQVRSLTHATIKKIVHYRPFHNLGEFILKVDARKEEIENLVRVGGFDGLGTIPDLLRELNSIPLQTGQLALFDPEVLPADDWPLEDKVTAQQALLGIALDSHPLDLYARQVAESGAISTVDAVTRVGQRVRVAGLRQILRRARTEKGAWMGFLTLEDLDGTIDVTIFPEVLTRAKYALSGSSIPLIIEGTVELDSAWGEPVILAEKVERVKG